MQAKIIQKEVKHRQTMGFGCGLLLALIVIGLGILVVLFLDQEREMGRYPNAIHVSSHSNYRALPREIRWDDSYRSADPFPTVYNWYSRQFNLGPEARANGGCILMQGTEQQIIVERYTGVMLCETPKGRMIFVTRSATIRN